MSCNSRLRAVEFPRRNGGISKILSKYLKTCFSPAVFFGRALLRSIRSEISISGAADFSIIVRIANGSEKGFGYIQYFYIDRYRFVPRIHFRPRAVLSCRTSESVSLLSRRTGKRVTTLL